LFRRQPAKSHGFSGGGSRRRQHHFESAEQQKDASTIGMWVFLVTEIMFFGGLFLAYFVYRQRTRGRSFGPAIKPICWSERRIRRF